VPRLPTTHLREVRNRKALRRETMKKRTLPRGVMTRKLSRQARLPATLVRSARPEQGTRQQPVLNLPPTRRLRMIQIGSRISVARRINSLVQPEDFERRSGLRCTDSKKEQHRYFEATVPDISNSIFTTGLTFSRKLLGSLTPQFT
jgi:hypothetical protein